MDPKHVETIDNIVSGYNKVKTLYKDNAEMIKKGKAWFKENRTIIIIVAIVLCVGGYYVYRQYQEGKTEVAAVSKKTAGKEKSAVVDIPDEIKKEE